MIISACLILYTSTAGFTLLILSKHSLFLNKTTHTQAHTNAYPCEPACAICGERTTTDEEVDHNDTKRAVWASVKAKPHRVVPTKHTRFSRHRKRPVNPIESTGLKLC